jgi:hypothetical protein
MDETPAPPYAASPPPLPNLLPLGVTALSPPKFVPSRRRALLAAGALDLQIVMCIALFFAYWQRLGFLDKINAGIPVVQADVAASDSLIRGLALFALVPGLAAGILFLMWVHRANRNLRAFCTEEPHYSPALAVGSFFIPILNFVWPFMVMREIWKGSDPDVPPLGQQMYQYAKLGFLVPLWWGLYLVRLVPTLVVTLTKSTATMSHAERLSRITMHTRWTLAGEVLGVVGAAVAVVLVLRVEQRQAKLAEMLAGGPAGAAEPAQTYALASAQVSAPVAGSPPVAAGPVQGDDRAQSGDPAQSDDAARVDDPAQDEALVANDDPAQPLTP